MNVVACNKELHFRVTFIHLLTGSFMYLPFRYVEVSTMIKTTHR